MNLELVGALNELEKERGISKEILIEAIEAAIVSAYKRHHGSAENVRVEMDSQTGEMRVFARKVVVEDVVDEGREISLAEAQEVDPNYQLNDVIEIEVTPRDFGRIAAQTAKQVVIQRIREAERALVYEEFSNREGDVVTGIVQRRDRRNVIIDLGKTEALLTPGDQMPTDRYQQGTRLKVYISEVKQSSKGPQVFVSRARPELLGRLFEMEVPEIHDGTVEIMAIAREAGSRSKIAVSSRDENVDPVGACVGPRGMRVQAVVQELAGEKIDIVAWSDDPKQFIANALSPARVVGVYLEEAARTARAVVEDDQLSLAIGKEGQNARLAARLTGWKIDIKNQEQMAKFLAEQMEREKQEKERQKAEDRAREEAEAESAPVPEPAEEEAAAPASREAVEEIPELPAEEPAEEPVEEELPVEEVEIEEVEDGAATPPAEEKTPPKRRPSPAVKPKKSRAAEKAEVEELIEEELIEEEPLPSLFDSEPAEEEEGEEKVFVFGSDDEGKEDEDSGEKDKKAALDKEKKVLKDLSALKEFFEK